MPIPKFFKAFPPDKEPDQAVGILLPLNRDTYEKDITAAGYVVPISKNVGIFSQSYSTEDQAISNLINLLLTRKGERPMQPDFGSPIPEYQFEQNSISNQDILEEGIRRDVKFWLPYIFVKNIRVRFGQFQEYISSELENSVEITISFSVTEIGANRTVTLLVNADSIQTTVI